MEKSKILITGAAGAVGRLLTPLLREQYSLRLCDVRPPDAAPGDEICQGDLAEPCFARQAVAGVIGVVHLAGLVASRVSFEDTLNSNYRALLAVLEACRVENVRRFVFTSSHHVLGMLPSDRAYDEHTLPAPDGFYALSKAVGEAACAMYAYRFGIGTLVLRIGNADRQVVDGRRERLWLSARDLAQLVTLGLTSGSLQYEVVNALSRCPAPILSSAVAQRLGYVAGDDAAGNHAAEFRPLAGLPAADGPGFVGGRFAADELPSLFSGNSD